MAKRMKIGAMRERVDIIQPVETVNDLGEKTETWEQQFVNVSAEVEYKSSQTDERYEAAKRTSLNGIVFRIRKRTMNEKMRVVYREKEHEILSISYTPDRCYMFLETIKDDQLLYSAE